MYRISFLRPLGVYVHTYADPGRINAPRTVVSFAEFYEVWIESLLKYIYYLCYWQRCENFDEILSAGFIHALFKFYSET